MAKSQYPNDYNPPHKGKCDVCKTETKGWTTAYLSRCPAHWQELIKR